MPGHWKDWELFVDLVDGGPEQFFVGGAICLVNSFNERDPALLCVKFFLEGLA